jgi:hypothetical protein
VADQRVPDSKKTELLGTSTQMAAALKQATGVLLVTFPMIFVRGKFIGGCDQLSLMISSGRFPLALAAPGTIFVPGQAEWGIELQEALQIQWFQGPRGGRWYCFQLYTYANMVRGISFLHVLVFAACIAAELGNLPQLSTALLWIIAVDLCIYILWGPVTIIILYYLVTLIACLKTSSGAIELAGQHHSRGSVEISRELHFDPSL